MPYSAAVPNPVVSIVPFVGGLSIMGAVLRVIPGRIGNQITCYCVIGQLTILSSQSEKTAATGPTLVTVLLSGKSILPVLLLEETEDLELEDMLLDELVLDDTLELLKLELEGALSD